MDDIISPGWIDTAFADTFDEVTSQPSYDVQHLMQFDVSAVRALPENAYVTEATLWLRVDAVDGGTAPLSISVMRLPDGYDYTRPMTWTSTQGGYELGSEVDSPALNAIHPLAGTVYDGGSYTADPTYYDKYGRPFYGYKGYKEISSVNLAAAISQCRVAPQNPGTPHLFGLAVNYKRFPNSYPYRICGIGAPENPYLTFGGPMLTLRVELPNIDSPD